MECIEKEKNGPTDPKYAWLGETTATDLSIFPDGYIAFWNERFEYLRKDNLKKLDEEHGEKLRMDIVEWMEYYDKSLVNRKKEIVEFCVDNSKIDIVLIQIIINCIF